MIWIVDDDTDEAYLLTRALSRRVSGLQLQCFHSPMLALESLELPSTELPTLVVTDLNMPGIDGLGFLSCFEAACIKKQAPCPTFLLASSVLPDNWQELIQIINCPVIVLQKPDLPQEFARIIASYT